MRKMASEAEPAPPYDDILPPDESPPEYEPSPYDEVAGSIVNQCLENGERPCLIIDDCLIHLDAQPEKPLYELSNPPTSIRPPIIGIENFYHRHTTDHSGRPVIRRRKRHMYNFSTESVGDLVPLSVVVVETKSSGNRDFKSVNIEPSITRSWTSCTVKGYFKAERSMKQRLSESTQLDWKDTKGRLVAVEIKPKRHEDATIEEPPKLEIQTTLEPKELDLLVTVWCARLWKETEVELSGPFSWTKCKFAIFY